MGDDPQRLTCPHCQRDFQSGGGPLTTNDHSLPSRDHNREVGSAPATAESPPDSPAIIVTAPPLAERRPVSPARTHRGTLYRLIAVGICLAVTSVVLHTAVRWQQTPPRPSGQRPLTTDRQTQALTRENTVAAEPIAAEPVTADNDSPPPSILVQLADGVVRIESDSPGDHGALGSGFVIDQSGLIATNYHVVAKATRARVRFKSGAVYHVDGYAAVDPDSDLAILKLHDPPPKLVSMAIRHEDEPPQLTPVIAVGHPSGIDFSTFDGTVSRMVSTSELPPRSREFLQRLISGRTDHRWIGHTAQIYEGYSGGPLLNDRGEVIGVNTWVDRQTGTGYAIHARHLDAVKLRLLPKIAPLAEFARHNGQSAELVERLSASHLRATFEAACGMRFKPASRDHYATLQDLAWTLTFANLPGSLDGQLRRGGLDAKQLDALIATANQITQSLQQQSWDGPGQLILVNEFAGPMLDQPRAGVFYFGTVQRIVAGDDGSRAAIVQLAGSEQMTFLPLEGQLIEPVAGESYLILGVNYDGHTVRYGENPLRPIIAPVILSRTWFRLGQ